MARLQNNLPGFEELSMLLPRREGGVYPGGFLALVSSCPSCLFLFRITVPFPAKSWALYLVTPGYLHIPWMGFPFRFSFLHYILTHSGKVIAWSRDDRGALEVFPELSNCGAGVTDLRMLDPSGRFRRTLH